MVHQVIYENVVMLRAQAKSKGVEIVFDNQQAGAKEVKHAIDEQRVQQVVMNLLSNAVKFSKSGDKISVKYSVASEESGQDKLTI